MLIVENKLDIEAFKNFFPSIAWTKLPRTLGTDHKDYFYTGLYEDEEKRVKITIRPSKVMAISETYKNRFPTNGAIPPETYSGQLVEWGASVEVKVDDRFISDVDSRAQVKAPRINQTLEW